MKKIRLDRTGKVYGRLTVTSFAGWKNGKSSWNCVCECGNTKVVSGQCLTSGGTSSCGCLYTENARAALQFALKAIRKEEKISEHPLYQTWATMKHRCYKTNDVGYMYYGGRGIKVCQSWLDDFENFVRDMGERPTGHTLDRIDNDRDYSPDNCRWATPKEQAANRRKPVTLEARDI